MNSVNGIPGTLNLIIFTSEYKAREDFPGRHDNHSQRGTTCQTRGYVEKRTRGSAATDRSTPLSVGMINNMQCSLNRYI